MKIKKIAAAFLASALLGTLSMGSAFAYESCHKSKWGPNDQLGALNNITKDNIMAAAKLIKKGKMMPTFKHTLFGIGKLCNNGCRVLFDTDAVIIFKKSNNSILLQGWRKPVGAKLW